MTDTEEIKELLKQILTELIAIKNLLREIESGAH